MEVSSLRCFQGEKPMPNFLDYIYVGGLEAVKPNAVNIIR